MKKNILALITYILLLALVIIFPFILDNTFDNSNTYLAIYIISKVVAVVLFIAVAIYNMIGKKANAVSVISMTTIIVYQLVPLLIRVILNSNTNSLVWSIITLFITTIIAVVIIGGIIINNEKMLESDEKYQGDTIPVKDAKDLYDENNKFRGIN